MNRRNPNPSAEILQEFEKELQTNGISKEVSWGRLCGDFQRIGFDTDKAASSIEDDDFTRRTNYLVSWYAAVENMILNTATGSAQAKQFEKLNSLY